MSTDATIDPMPAGADPGGTAGHDLTPAERISRALGTAAAAPADPADTAGPDPAA